jgi:hypothetical protein
VPGNSPNRAHKSCVEAQRIASVFVVFLHSGLHDYLRLPRIDGLLSIRSKCASVTLSSAGSKRDLTHLPNFQLSSLWPLGRCRCSKWPLCLSVVSTWRYQPRAQTGSTQPLWFNRQTHTCRSVCHEKAPATGITKVATALSKAPLPKCASTTGPISVAPPYDEIYLSHPQSASATLLVG